MGVISNPGRKPRTGKALTAPGFEAMAITAAMTSGPRSQQMMAEAAVTDMAACNAT